MANMDTTALVLFNLRLAEGDGLSVNALAFNTGADPVAIMWSLARLAVLRAVHSRGERWYAR